MGQSWNFAEGSNLVVSLSVRGIDVAIKVLTTITTRKSVARLCAFKASIVGFTMLTRYVGQYGTTLSNPGRSYLS